MTTNQNMHKIPLKLFERLKALNPNFKTSNYFQKFGELSTNAERVNYAFKDLKKYNLFPKFTKDSKDDSIAADYREEGNRIFGFGDYKQALECYTRSLLYAKSKPIAAVAYANRSACLYKLEMYQECLVDIERAITNNYPSHLVPKLIQRRTYAEKLLKPTKPYHDEVPVVTLAQRNPLIQCAKNCIKIETNEKYGKHVTAVRDIQIGEVLNVEKPFACGLVNERSIHCHRCMALCYNLIPCDNCTMALFCGENCKTEAFNTYHKDECPVLFSLVASAIDVMELIALKIAILAKADYHRLNMLQMDNFYRSDRYREVHNLMPATESRSLQNLYEKAVVAAVIFNFYKNHTIFFNGITNELAKEGFKEVLLLQLQIVDLNELGIYEKVYNVFEDDGLIYAIGLYPFTSLYNHACSSNVELYQYGSTMVARALATIKKGQQCFISYGQSYDMFPREMRQDLLLQQFFFKCDCKACEQDWSLLLLMNLFKFPVHLDLKKSQLEVFFWQMEVSVGNAEAAKDFLLVLIPALRRCEPYEPWGNALRIKGLVEECFRVCGNKRMV